jgi:hypothetical protein
MYRDKTHEFLMKRQSSVYEKARKPILIDGVEHPSVNAAAKALNTDSSYIRNCIKNKKLCKGAKVEYKRDA